MDGRRPQIFKNESRRIMRNIIIGIRELFFLIIMFPAARLYGRKKNIWIISERGTDARDNGYHMFRYMRTEHPDIDVFFIIDKKSSDRKRIINYGNIIDYRSLKHYFYQYAANVRMSTHIYGFASHSTFYRLINKKFKFPGVSISLKHGITKDNIPGLYAENARLDLVIAGAKPEYDYMLSKFHYDSKSLKYTGFARFDNLVNTASGKQILVMPTWRSFLSGISEEEFNKSTYFVQWQGFLNDPLLHEKLASSGVKLIFYPHYEIQRFIHLFVSRCSSIIIASKENYDVQELLKSSDILITDYSSVFFDFAYMNKPCLYYLFDEGAYRESHYNQGYFDYRTMGFGEVVSEKDELLTVLFGYIETGFANKKEYLERHRQFFPLHDHKNCERIYQAILSIMK
jgi:CDP-glycerol glycerophosphotransferase (TagB/SpsB family)